MPNGKVKFFNAKSRFGFIHDPESKTDYYFKVNKQGTDFKADDEVSFEIRIAKRGPEAINVRLLSTW